MGGVPIRLPIRLPIRPGRRAMATSEVEWEHWSRAPFDMTFLSGGQSGKRGSLIRIAYQLGHSSPRSTRINSYFGIVSDDLDGTNRGLSGHILQSYLASESERGGA